MNAFTDTPGIPKIADSPSVAVAEMLVLMAILFGAAACYSAGSWTWRHRSKWKGRVKAICRRPWHLEDCIFLGAVVILCYLVLLVLARTGITSSWENPGEVSMVSLVLQTALMPLCGLVAVIFLAARNGTTIRRAFGIGIHRPRVSLRLAMYAYLAAIPPVIAAGVVYMRILTLIGSPLTPQPVVDLLADTDAPLTAMTYLAGTAVIIAPIFEEIIFRGIALPILLRRFPPLVAICLVSLLFAALHFHTPSFAALFTISSAFSIAYIWTGSLTVSIYMHAIFNAANIGILVLTRGSILTH